MPLEDEKPLEGWKAIARFLGRSVKTVQRWEQRGLPVHRHEVLGVIAYPSDLETWKRASTSHPEIDGQSGRAPAEHWPKRTRRFATAALAIGILLVVWIILRRPRDAGRPESDHFGRLLARATSENGQTRWIDLSFEAGQMNVPGNNTFVQRYFLFSLGIHLFENGWFRPQKIE